MMKTLMTLGMFVGFGVGYLILYMFGINPFSMWGLVIPAVPALACIWLPWKLFKDYID